MLKNIALAFHSYADTHEGRLPPAVVYGKDGKALYSWRVVLLQFLSQGDLYARFKLDEPWDSPNNIKLVEEMPGIYDPPHYHDNYIPAHHTICHILIGPRTPFERNGLRMNEEDMPRGTANTILLAEAGNPVPWSKPEDINFDPDRPIWLRGPFRSFFRVAFADGSVRRIPYTESQAGLLAFITRNGDEFQEIPPNW